MNYPLFLARRLSLASGGRKTSPAVRVAVTAVALSVGVMIAALAIVLGFKREIRDKVIGFNSHITLYAVPQEESEDNLITLTPTLREILDAQDFITDFSLEASIPAILKTSDNFKGVYLKSIQGATSENFIKENIRKGKFPDFSKKENRMKTVISEIAARQLGLDVGDRIETYFIAGDVRVRKLEVAAIYNSHFDSYDDIFIYGDLGLIQSLGQISEKQGTSIVINTDDFDRVEEYTQTLQNTFNTALAEGTLYKFYRVDNARRRGAGYFGWLDMLDTNVIVILTLMTFVACVTLISGMLIIILDKKRFIGLIRSMGATERKVRKVFVYMAIRVALTGLLIGNALMLAFLYCQARWHFIPLDPDAYYIDFMPVEFNIPAIVILNAATIAIIYLCLILPSWFAAKISPAETMRYE